MRRVRIEFAARFWFPHPGDSGRRWGWRRWQEILTMDVPTQAGSHTVVALPPPMFSYSAADLIRFELANRDGRKIEASLFHNGMYLFRGVPWTETALWTQQSFDPSSMWWTDPPDMPNLWWLRWRCPDAADVMTLIMNVLDVIDSDPYDPTATRERVSLLRREILLNSMGAPIHRSLPRH